MDYTKGPWEVRPGYGLLMSEIGPPDRAVATVWTERQSATSEGKNIIVADEMGRVNAQLIAAAPDMYEALKDLIESYDLLINEVLPIGSNATRVVKGTFLNINKARQALAKAEGKI